MTESSSSDWSPGRPIFWGFLGVFVLVGGFGAWAAFSEINGAVIAPGQIEVEQNRQVVQHPDGGVVETIHVVEGDVVEAGDLLITLDGETLRTELSMIEGQIFEFLARSARFSAERDSAEALEFDEFLLASDNPATAELMEGQRRLFEARMISEDREREQLSQRRSQVAIQITGFQSQKAALERQLALITGEVANQRSLFDRGLTESSRLLALEREQANLEGQIGELEASVAEAEGRITEAGIEIIRLETERRETAISSLRDLQYELFELFERRQSLLIRLDQLDLRAPTSGIVYNMQVFARRSVIRPAEAVLYVIPQDRPLVITAKIAPQDIDQIFVGQSVAIRFPAFDQRTTPALDGRVLQVSADTFMDERTQQPFYRAEISIDEGQLDRLPEDKLLLPGMPVEAFVATDARTPLAYFVRPFTDYFAKAFRES